MTQFTASADSLNVIVRDARGQEVERFARTGLESMRNMDMELIRRDYILMGGWSTKKIEGAMLHARGMRR